MSLRTYCLFHALKLHFTSKSYDYFKFQGKIRMSESSFQKKNDKYMYARLEKKFTNQEDLVEHIVANLLVGKKWVGEFLENEAFTTSKQYKKILQSLSKSFEEEIYAIRDNDSLHKFSDLFRVVDNEYPPLIDAIYERKISYISLTVMNDLIPFVAKFDKCFGKGDMLWSGPSLLITKLRPFVTYDRKTIIDILDKFVLT